MSPYPPNELRDPKSSLLVSFDLGTESEAPRIGSSVTSSPSNHSFSPLSSECAEVKSASFVETFRCTLSDLEYSNSGLSDCLRESNALSPYPPNELLEPKTSAIDFLDWWAESGASKIDNLLASSPSTHSFSSPPMEWSTDFCFIELL